MAIAGCRTPAAVAPSLPPRASAAAPGALLASLSRSGRPEVAFDPAARGGAITLHAPTGLAAAASSTATPLSEAQTQALLARLEPLPDPGDPRAAPALRAPTPAPPRAGAVTPIAFVTLQGKPVTDAPPGAPRPPPPPPPVAAGPLAPPQISPEGAVRAESAVRVRFDDAMVPVAADGTVATPPITIAPAVPGSWRWIDTRVAQFTAAAARFPSATSFTVTVPAGTRSLAGATLAAPTVATFQTPPLAIAGVWPTTVRPDTVLVVQLDQAFDADAIAPLVRVLGKGNQPLAWKRVDLATARASWAKFPEPLDGTLALARPHLLVAPATTWPAGLDAQLELAPGAPSREGPLRATRASYGPFDVVGPMRVVGIQCGDMHAARRHGAVCHADDALDVTLSNDLLASAYRSPQIQIAGMPLDDHTPSGRRVSLATPAHTNATHAVAITGPIVDVYGQPLVGARDASFRTRAARYSSSLEASSEGMHVLDPRLATPHWRIEAQSVGAIRVQLYRVAPADYFAFTHYEHGTRATPPGKLVVDRSYPVGGRYHATLNVDLRPALDAAGVGHVIAIATAAPTAPAVGPAHKAVAWLQVTRLALDTRFDREHLEAYVQQISPARFLQPVVDAQAQIVVENRPPAPAAPTDAAGHARLALLEPDPGERRGILAVTAQTDTTFVPFDTYERTLRKQRALWFVTDDRFTYKPGETVYVKGWVRATHDGANPDLALPPRASMVSYRVQDSRGNKVVAGTAPFTAQGGFDFEIPLPPNVNLGTAIIALSTENGMHRHPIAIEEFRKPAFAVSLDDDVSHRGATPLVVGESLEMAASARYYAGGGLAGAEVRWDATLVATRYQPPGWDRFDFSPVRDQPVGETTAGTTNTLAAASTARVVFGLAALPGHRPSLFEVDATVTDVDRASIRATSRKILVHPSTYYVGLRLLRDDTLEAVVTDIDGAAVAGVPITVEIEAVLPSEAHRSAAVVQDRQRCAPTSGTAPVRCAWKRKHVGKHPLLYRAVARVTDARGRANTAAYAFPWYVWPTSDEKRDFDVVPDRAVYQPGDVAKLAIKSDLLPATALVAFARNGLVAERRVALVQPVTTIELPIEPTFVQNVHVLVDRVAGTAKAATLPRRVSRAVELAVDREGLRLAMTARPLAKLVEPGSEATFEIEVRHGDRPKANAEVALMVVDEGVLALAARDHADPLEPFYRRYDARVASRSSVDLVEDGSDRLGATPGLTRTKLDAAGLHRYGYGGGGTGWGTIGSGHYGTIGHGSAFGSGSAVVAARKDFRANAVFSPKLVTDARGRARVTVKMPDSLSRFRIVALATADTYYFGKAEGAITTQRKLNARTVAPRFLTQGDTFALPVVVQNLDRTPRTIDVAMRAANLAAVGPSGKRITIPAGQRAEVRFDFTTRARGKAVVQTIVTSGAFADATTVEVPVYEPATTESFATYGVVDGDAPAFEQLVVPKDLFPDVGAVEVELASTQLQSLTDAYWYLHGYPYECAEQRSARMIATATMADLLDAFATPGRPSRAELAATRASDLHLLGKQQAADGGWGYFSGMRSDPYVTTQVLTALALVKASGPVVKKARAFVERDAQTVVGRLEAAVRKPDIERRDRDAYPYLVSLAASSLTALAATGTDTRARAERLHGIATTLAAYPVDAKARLLAIVAKLPRAAAMRQTLLRALTSATHETAAAATVTTRYVEAERLLLVSSTKTTALVLDALLRERPEHALVVKLARGVLDGRKHGRWRSTQENLVALQALRRYFDTHERETPHFAGKLWFGQAAYAEQAFEGRSGVRANARVGWPALGPSTTHDLALAKQGPGRMYYRVGITYAPRRADLPALDAGFVVRRSYTAVDDPADVVPTPTGYRIRLGAKVLVTIETLVTTRRYNVAVVDPLPAGFEAVNENLATAERGVAASNHAWDHVNLRDNRSEAFAEALVEGSHRFAYTVRATTPGTFLAAPAKAEEMYSPETFGRTTGQTVVVE